jgi:hypothetical protein
MNIKKMLEHYFFKIIFAAFGCHSGLRVDAILSQKETCRWLFTYQFTDSARQISRCM